MKLLKKGLKKQGSSKIKSIIVMVFFALLSALLVSAGDVIVKNGEINATENVTAVYFFGDGSQLTGISDGNCSSDNSCPLIVYEDELNYTTDTNCTDDNSCPLITYESDSLACSRLTGNTSDLCSIIDTGDSNLTETDVMTYVNGSNAYLTRLDGPSGDALKVGTGTDSHALGSSNDLFVTGKFETNGQAFFDSTAFFNSQVLIDDDSPFYFGTDSDTSFGWMSDQSPATFIMGLSDITRTFLIVEAEDIPEDMGHPAQTNPTLFIHSSDSDTVTDWISLSHDQTNGVIDVGGGDLTFPPEVVLNNTVYVTGDKVGVGTNSPNSVFHVSGSTSGTDAIARLAGPHSQLMLLDDDDNNFTHLSYSSDVLAFRNNDVSATPTLAIHDDGKIGIGTITPNAELQVVGEVNATGFVGQPYGYAELDNIGTAGDGTLAFGDGSNETSLGNGVTWDGTNNYFTVDNTGVYEVYVDAVIGCASISVFDFDILVDGVIQNRVEPVCHSSVDPVSRTIRWVGSISSGSIVNATIDSIPAVNIDFTTGSTFIVKRIG